MTTINGMRVKPLEWQNIGRCAGWSLDNERTHLHSAYGLGVFYEVTIGKDGWYAKWSGSVHPVAFGSPEAAKAAAQADYEARILAALEPVEGGDNA